MSEQGAKPKKVENGQVWRDARGIDWFWDGHGLTRVDPNENRWLPMSILPRAEELLESSDWIFVSGPSGAANVFEASKRGDTGTVRDLLAADAGLANAREAGSITPLHTAAMEGHKKIVELLLHAGADVNAANDWGVTPLYLAAAWGHKDVVSVLVDRGADTQVTDQNGETPAQAASRKGHQDIVRLLTDTSGTGRRRSKWQLWKR